MLPVLGALTIHVRPPVLHVQLRQDLVVCVVREGLTPTPLLYIPLTKDTAIECGRMRVHVPWTTSSEQARVPACTTARDGDCPFLTPQPSTGGPKLFFGESADE